MQVYTCNCLVSCLKIDHIICRQWNWALLKLPHSKKVKQQQQMSLIFGSCNANVSINSILFDYGWAGPEEMDVFMHWMICLIYITLLLLVATVIKWNVWI